MPWYVASWTMPQRLARGLLVLALFAGSRSIAYAQPSPPGNSPPPISTAASDNLETATFGAGCFWCSEAVFQRLKGVHNVVSGYSGGHVVNPTYAQVLTGFTGHAEVVQVTFDPRAITYAELLDIFWNTHDPTTLNRQGPDFGTQYRSVIFYHGDEQRRLAQERRAALDADKVFRDPIVTQIEPFGEFYRAEDYHQNYYRLHRRQPYCVRVIRPKVTKLENLHPDRVVPASRSPAR